VHELTKLNEFKEGMGFIAVQSGVPVVPVAIIGSEEMMAQIDQPGFSFLEERKKIISARPRLEIMVSIGRPIFGITDRIELTQLCFASISEQVADLERIDNFYIV